MGTIIPVDLGIDMDGEDPSEPGDIKVVSDFTVIEDCDSTAGWTMLGTTTGGTFHYLKNTNVQQGSGCLTIAVAGGTTTATLIYTDPTTSYDISGGEYLQAWTKTSNAPGFLNCRLYFGESTWNEQSSTGPGFFTIKSSDGWKQRSWDISGISTASRNAVTKVAITVETTSTSAGTYQFIDLDYVVSNAGAAEIKGFDGDRCIRMYPKSQAGVYQGTGSTQTISLNAKGTPDYVMIQNMTPGDGTANYAIHWFKGTTTYYSARLDGGTAVSTDWIIAVGDGSFDLGTGVAVNENLKTYGYHVQWNDSTST